MAQLIVRNIEESLKQTLKRQADAHGHSMEEEVRQILLRAVQDQRQMASGLGTKIAARFAGIGIDEDLPEMKGHIVEPHTFEDGHT